MNKLGPCPLCGGEAKHNSGTVSVKFVAWCPECEVPRMDTQTWNQLGALAAENKRMREENELLIWNLAGCSTIATSEKPQEFNQDMARPALHDVNSMAIKFQRMREALERCRRMFGRMVDGDLPDDPSDWAAMCDEALKGGER